MKRREFINWVGLAGISGSLPIAIAACTSETASGDWQTVGNAADLDKNGELLVKNWPNVNVLVVGTSQSDNLIAVDPTCTHAGCTVTWQTEAKNFNCRCHGSEFAADGSVQKGPATEPLKTYTAKIENDSVLVQAN
ncbi:MAG: ubiquinol-cytochrome c reductase iron-sulfur subunit [Nostoc sp. LLA-1]|nr:ubiquinol-cytochrome c reductase iron-sulfur subunit [Cyanocohniella sp. LLY]